MPSGLILGIETSCDETAAAVVRHGTETLSSVIASQIDLHALYGGVVPELASREHLRNIVPVVREAIARAGISLSQLDAIAVTSGPGLAGALLVGITYAKSLAFALAKPLLAINHLEGHIFAVLMQHAETLLPSTPPGAPHMPASSACVDSPLIALVVSGGHTHLYRANRTPGTDALHYQTLGRTVDDAAGEAFDKVAKLLGLPYPGGPWIDALAPLGNPLAIPFRFAAIQPRTPHPTFQSAVTPIEGQAAMKKPASSPALRPAVISTGAQRSGETPAFASSPQPAPNLDFSFSGIKTAVLRHLQTHTLLPAAEHRRHHIPQTARATPELIASLCAQGLLPPDLLDLVASFQHAVVGRLLKQTLAAVDQTSARAILVTGGVAANSELRRRFSAEAIRRHLPIAFPTLALSTDNAAMIAAAAWPRLLAGEFAPSTLSATPQLRLG